MIVGEKVGGNSKLSGVLSEGGGTSLSIGMYDEGIHFRQKSKHEKLTFDLQRTASCGGILDCKPVLALG